MIKMKNKVTSSLVYGIMPIKN